MRCQGTEHDIVLCKSHARKPPPSVYVSSLGPKVSINIKTSSLHNRHGTARHDGEIIWTSAEACSSLFEGTLIDRSDQSDISADSSKCSQKSMTAIQTRSHYCRKTRTKFKPWKRLFIVFDLFNETISTSSIMVPQCQGRLILPFQKARS